jgi:hypothetical protein
MKKIIFFLLIGILIFATTLTKNSTKKIDKKIFETKENMVFLKNKYELVLLDYNYLSSPKKLMNYQNEYFENYLIPKKIDKINEIIFDENTSKIQIIDKNLNE